MTPQEKAKELVDKYLTMENTLNIIDLPYLEMSKQCALIAVDEIISLAYWEYMESNTHEEKIYWQELRNEIEKI
jgi:hypothetical protein